MLPIKETKELLVAGFQGAAIFKSALADGKIGIGDIGLILPLIGVLNSAVDGIDQVPAELADLSEGEYDELVEAARPYIVDLAPEQIQAVIFEVLAIVKGLLGLFKLLK